MENRIEALLEEIAKSLKLLALSSFTAIALQDGRYANRIEADGSTPRFTLFDELYEVRDSIRSE
jgi:hypothetical protein